MNLLTTIYSQPSIEAFETLVYTFLKTFQIKNKDINDMFYYNVFCSAPTYANYDWETVVLGNPSFKVPFNLYAPCSQEKDRIEFVEMTIKEVLEGKTEKPGWMTFIEMETSCGPCDSQPSNFLRLMPKDEKYRELGEALIDFLYSPNRTTVAY